MRIILSSGEGEAIETGGWWGSSRQDHYMFCFVATVVAIWTKNRVFA